MNFRSWHRICAAALLLTIGVPLRLAPSLNWLDSTSRHGCANAFVPSNDKGGPGDVLDESSDESRGVLEWVTDAFWDPPSTHYPRLLLLLSIQAPILLMMRLVRTSYASSAI